MIVHYITRATNDASLWPIGKALKKNFSTVCFFSKRLVTNYKNRIDLFIKIYPKWIFLSLRLAYCSVMNPNRPNIVILESDIDILCYKFISKLFFRNKMKIWISSFVYSRRGGFLGKIKYYYYRFILNQVFGLIVHSKKEQEEYHRLFGKCKIIFVPFGTEVNINTCPYSKQNYERDLVLSAGRSSRDYYTLINAVKDTHYRLQIIDDGFDSSKYPFSKNVEIIRDCFEYDFLSLLMKAAIVVIPLIRDDISAGHMVLLQSMALRKPIIITESETIVDYLIIQPCVELVKLRDIDDLRLKINKVMNNVKYRTLLAKNAGLNYDRYFTSKATADLTCKALNN